MRFRFCHVLTVLILLTEVLSYRPAPTKTKISKVGKQPQAQISGDYVVTEEVVEEVDIIDGNGGDYVVQEEVVYVTEDDPGYESGTVTEVVYVDDETGVIDEETHVISVDRDKGQQGREVIILDGTEVIIDDIGGSDDVIVVVDGEYDYGSNGEEEEIVLIIDDDNSGAPRDTIWYTSSTPFPYWTSPPQTYPPWTYPTTTPAPFTYPPWTYPTTTPAPLTYPPWTYPPTTPAPLTYPPWTYPPTTPAPLTYPPWTYPPTTPAPLTYPPWTYPPTTPPPLTYPPWTYPPTTPAPLTYPPWTYPPTTPPPLTYPPWTYPPTTPPPLTYPPWTYPPTTPAPLTYPPWTYPPTQIPWTYPPNPNPISTTNPTSNSSCGCTMIINNNNYNYYNQGGLPGHSGNHTHVTTTVIHKYPQGRPTVKPGTRNGRKIIKRVGNKQRIINTGNGARRRLMTRKILPRNLGVASGTGNVQVFRVLNAANNKKQLVKNLRKRPMQVFKVRPASTSRNNTVTWKVVPRWQAQRMQKLGSGVKIGQVQQRRVVTPGVRKANQRLQTNKRLRFNNKVMRMNKKTGNNYGLQDLDLGLQNKLVKRKVASANSTPRFVRKFN
ncbi:unnamed protein product [Allacma fusca]|uniref:Uncharacterized protein n=1 Tax=Allacma fusca TaxID=39272 RepID=A0A8J2PWC7_9HEXA|nr:unnamed protein product [Allacma fusca]